MAQTIARRNLPRRKMVRKQVYLLPQQELKLKELAQEQLTTEAELIRKAVEAFLSQPTTKFDKQLPPDEAAWQVILASFEETKKRNISGEPHRWTREDYYDDPRYQRNWPS